MNFSKRRENIRFSLKKNPDKKSKRKNQNYLAPVAGYEYTPSIIKSGNRYGTVVSVVNKFGMNRANQYGWFVDIIPQASIPSVKTYLFMSSKPLTKKEQTSIFNKKLNDTIKTLDNTNASKAETEGEEELRALHVKDLAEYSRKDTKQELAIDFQILMLLVSDNPDDVVEQLRILKKNYADDMNGIDLMSVAGDQKSLFKRLIAMPRKSVYDYSTMSSEFAGFDHSVRKGLDDEKGVSIGEITLSLSSGNALMDLNGSFSKRILVSASSDSYIYSYDKKLAAASMWGQKIANHAMAYNHRTFHIVLNDFKYYGDNHPTLGNSPFSCEPVMNTALKHIDLSRGGLNPLEMFGDPRNATEIYNSNKRKIAQMFYYATERYLDKNTTLELQEILNDFYYGSNLWHPKVDEYPELARVLDVKNHESVPTSGDFISWLKQNLTVTREHGTEQEVNNAKALHLALQNALDSYPNLFNTPTTLSKANNPNILQYYYEFSGLRGDPSILEAQFLNAFDFITHLALEGDIIMIHGVDNLTTETLDIVRTRINRLMDSGIRMAYLFDRIATGNPIKISKDENIYYSDMFNTKDILFENFESQFDYTILGTMNKDDFIKYEKLIKQKLPKDLQDIITATNQPLQYQIRRPSDLTSNYILGDFII
ncbi:hypothetical protein [Macrococcus carouselicus]|uniref:Uncharacterized protein n=1 Tax=Macrococcus carouselicus TaxID=69969 RepID=A0A9Q8CJ39_9STAP|nr:hypothetical protein [Macrococcus carouselicus]TDL95524.1 hypothetical protein ERX40_10095 [Macrococcus carouselicus]